MLRDLLDQPLPMKIPIGSHLLTYLSSLDVDQGVIDKMFEGNDEDICRRLEVQAGLSLTKLLYGPSKESVHYLWDLTMATTLRIVFPLARFDRYPSRDSDNMLYRPSLLFVVDGVCVFRGEETESYMKIEVAREELCANTLWSYGQVPCVFGYAASGCAIQFFALCPDGASKVKSHLIASFYLELEAERLRMMLAIMHLSPLFSAISRACPASGRNDFEVFRRPSGVVVHCFPLRVEKRYPRGHYLSHIESAYRALETPKVPNVVRLVELDWYDYTRRTTLGTLNVLEALVVLHRDGWAHGDIRWSKVLKRRDREAWFLIDLDEATISPQRHPCGTYLTKDDYPAEFSQGLGNLHTAAADIWSVGYLIESCDPSVGWACCKRRMAFLKRPLANDPPTAEQALCELRELENKSYYVKTS